MNGEGCVLVTGASRGIGAAVAKALAGEGWPVGVNFHVDAAGAERVCGEIEALGGRAVAVRADVADAAAVDAAFDLLEAEFGPVLVLVNNAGIRHDRLLVALRGGDWGRVLAVNLGGTFHATRRAVGPMLHQRFGRIVNVTTVSTRRPLPGQAAYAASKAGVEALTRTVAVEVARRGVTVNAVAPGMVRTGFLPDVPFDWSSLLPMRRPAEPVDVAACVRFLASEEAAYVSGAVIPVDGAFGVRLALPPRSQRPAETCNETPSREEIR